MFTIVREAPSEVRVGIDCPSCKIAAEEGKLNLPSFLKDVTDAATLFFSEESKQFITNCMMCGVICKEEELVMESYTQCQECDAKIKIKDIRQNVPCESCDEINNRVVATTKYYSQINKK